jgi:DNA-damage-inducible protein D
MNALVHYFDGEAEVFEAKGVSNGGRYWLARDFGEALGYKTFAAFKKAINRAMQTCATLNLPILDNFREYKAESGALDYKLSRFGCYLVAMNGDIRKPQVAAAQAYLAGLAETVQKYVQDGQDVERVQNAGYRGMYNMNISALKTHKGIHGSKRSLLDFMGKRELAGNLFRITETDAKLKADKVRGQKPAEKVATRVGKTVRKIMIDNTGETPESLPFSGDIKKIQTDLRKTAKAFEHRDGPVKLAGSKDDVHQD